MRRIKSGKFGHQINSNTFANSENPDEKAPNEPSHQEFHCLLSLFFPQYLKYETSKVTVQI